MCGIAGLWSFDGSDPGPAGFDRFVDALAHRGPDGRGAVELLDGALRLGHRRLSILDTSEAGAQPMWDASGRFAIVFNGEIYNFIELRDELAALGHRFRSGTDTEVALEAFARWGPACQLRFNGMWAFAVWDARERRLFGSRDRFGVKPFLYHHLPGHRVAIASELKAFAALPEVPLDLDREVLTAPKSARFEGTERTVLSRVHRLLPGHQLEVDAGGRLRISRWWSTRDHVTEAPSRHRDRVELFRATFLDACRLRMRSDVPIGTSLSGGLDSSSVLAGVHHVGTSIGAPVAWRRAFVQGLPGSPLDEQVWAERMAADLGIEVVRTDVPRDRIRELALASVLALESPRGLALGIHAHYAAVRADGVRVSIDGHGGDELLAGYSGFVTRSRRARLRAGRLPAYLRELRVGAGLEGFGPYGRTVGAGAARLVGQDLRSIGRDPHARLAAEDAPADASPLGRDLHRAFHRTTLPTILERFDRLSMASGVEIRSPLLDWRVVTLAFGLPDEALLGAGATKRILREAMRGDVPDAILRRRQKVGFNPAIPQWLDAGLADLMSDVAAEPSFRSSPHLDGPAVAADIASARDSGDSVRLGELWDPIQAHLLVVGLERIRREAEAARAG